MYQRACCASLSVLSLANPGLAFLRYAFLLRLEDRGRPSVACPFAGPRVHWTLGKSPAHPWQARSPDARLFPAHPPPYDGFLSLRAQSKEPKERAPRTLRPQTPRVPSLRTRLRRSAQGPSLSRARTHDLLCFALRALACKSGARRPWRARSAGQRFTGPLP